MARSAFFRWLGACPAAVVLLLAGASTVCAANAWSLQKSGTLAWLRAVQFIDQDKGWAVGGTGVLLSTSDGGATWTAMRKPTDDALRDVFFTDENNGWLICERSVYQLKTRDEQRTYLMITSDGGDTWRRFGLSQDPDARLLRILFGADGRGLVFGEGGMIFVTRDGGNIWTRKRAPTRHILLGGSLLDSRQMWLVGAGTTIVQTSDGGETWRAALAPGNNDIRFTAVSFVDPARGWAVGSSGRIFMTIDGGRTWYRQQSDVTEDLNDVKFVDASEGWVAGAGGVLLHTTDGGFHWRSESLNTTHPLERLFFINRDRGWVVGFGGTVFTYAARAALPPPQLKGTSGANE